MEAPQSFSASGTLDVPQQWWRVFDDPALNAVVEDALASNLDLQAAWQRLLAAQAVVDREAAVLWPTLEGTARAGLDRGTATGEGTDELELGLAARYEVDLWGRLRASVQAERFEAAATAADYQAAALSLSAAIVQTWYGVAEARRQLALVEEQVATNQAVLTLLENRFEIGVIRAVDVLRQRQLIEATQEQAAVVGARRQTLEHRLAVLLGRPPRADFAELPQVLPDLSPLPSTGVPADLVRRRPDVQQAWFRLQAADRSLAAAISSQYPRLTLGASVRTAAASADNLFREWALSFAADLLAPIFLGGELRAEVDRTRSVRQQRVYEYGQATLVAFREVEDALVQEARQRDRIEHLDAQVELANQAFRQLRIQYFNGAADYLAVLTALDEVQQLQRDRIAAELALVDVRIGLYRALAGPLGTEALETEGQS